MVEKDIILVTPVYDPVKTQARKNRALLTKDKSLSLGNVKDGEKTDDVATFGQLKSATDGLKSQIRELQLLVTQVIKTIPPGVNSVNTVRIDVGGAINGSNDTFVLAKKIVDNTEFIIIDGIPYRKSQYSITGTDLKILDAEGLPQFSLQVYGVPAP